jgi:hypothetical protein
MSGSPENADTIQLFLAELAELTQKHKLVIGGCGCCYSPYLYPLGERATHSAIFADELKYDKTANRYTVTNEEERERIHAEWQAEYEAAEARGEKVFRFRDKPTE